MSKTCGPQYSVCRCILAETNLSGVLITNLPCRCVLQKHVKVICGFEMHCAIHCWSIAYSGGWRHDPFLGGKISPPARHYLSSMRCLENGEQIDKVKYSVSLFVYSTFSTSSPYLTGFLTQFLLLTLYELMRY